MLEIIDYRKFPTGSILTCVRHKELLSFHYTRVPDGFYHGITPYNTKWFLYINEFIIMNTKLILTQALEDEYNRRKKV